ncbi:hypothetical protein SELMODRAFT_413603 [Selaginella moellendorffii]|uniref:Peptidase A1 domain-containing protein n=1 Tax=Selaginella moellendorffii TaxID=88036 RepID=D8RQT8_SELML|nr:aspartic proteinase-like protein 2 [Selaginella moellendorffii]EFJ25703.1 hypothetical protein SELMODRAFT_413603 [Selaginella moellendorffii]|eukprot:XP_002973329.1 aspartic proteinase-like protein 2 [Selaginella moellendorffii]
MNSFLNLCFLLALLLGAGEGAGILKLQHRYSGLEGSSKQNEKLGLGMSKHHLQHLVEHNDRRGRFLQGISFPLKGNYSDLGLYYTEIGLGNPVQKLKVIVDTGSDILWVKCSPCRSCLSKQDIIPPLSIYNLSASSTSSVSSCSDPLCTGEQAVCSRSGSNSACAYGISYQDKSTSIGAYVKDDMHYVLQGGNATTSHIFFGCAINITGSWPADGIMGFGQISKTVPNQIATQRNMSRVFSHCLGGEKHGGGILEFGEEPNTTEMVFTPLLNVTTHYNVDLLSISVNSKVLPIDSKEFSYVSNSTNETGVIIDSGTSFALLATKANRILFSEIKNLTTAKLGPKLEGLQCFYLKSGLTVETSFPNVTLTFSGGSTMKLKPDNYLVMVELKKKRNGYCYAWSSADGLTIFGEIVLKDKLVFYDVENRRIGWKGQNCSS